MNVLQVQSRKKLAATANRREGVYNRTDEPSVTFRKRSSSVIKQWDHAFAWSLLMSLAAAW